MEPYLKLLEKAKSKLPEIKESKERFEVPKALGHIEGNKTIITNFTVMCSALGRDQQHVLKYLQRELATPAYIDGPRLILGRKIDSTAINKKILQYTEDFVICKECKKPDTKIMKEGIIYILKCMACGAKHPIRAKI